MEGESSRLGVGGSGRYGVLMIHAVKRVRGKSDGVRDAEDAVIQSNNGDAGEVGSDEY